MKRWGPATGAKAGLVLAHGRGGTAIDILGLAAAAHLTDVAAIAPEAPGQSWWPTSFLAPSAVLAPYLGAALSEMAKAVAALEAEGLARNRIWLAGFSQGACLALEAFARAGDGLAGVIGFSGGLVGLADKGGGPQEALYGYGAKSFGYGGRRDEAKVWLSIHERDPHIPLLRAKETEDALRAMGAEVQLRVYPGAGHSVMPDGLSAMKRLLEPQD